MIIGCVGTASAGLFKKKANVYVFPDKITNANGETETHLITDVQTNGKTIGNKTIEVTVKDELTNKEEVYTVTTTDKRPANVCKLESGHKYYVTAKFAGDDEYKTCNLTDYPISA